MAKRKRDYKKEYREFHAKPEQKKRRAERNKARRKAIRKGHVKKGDGKHVHHVGAKRKGSLKKTKTKILPAKKNLKIQPKRKK